MFTTTDKKARDIYQIFTYTAKGNNKKMYNKSNVLLNCMDPKTICLVRPSCSLRNQTNRQTIWWLCYRIKIEKSPDEIKNKLKGKSDHKTISYKWKILLLTIFQGLNAPIKIMQETWGDKFIKFSFESRSHYVKCSHAL